MAGLSAASTLHHNGGLDSIPEVGWEHSARDIADMIETAAQHAGGYVVGTFAGDWGSMVELKGHAVTMMEVASTGQVAWTPVNEPTQPETLGTASLDGSASWATPIVTTVKEGQTSTST